MTTEAPLSPKPTARESAELLGLLYLCPVGIAKLDAGGYVELLNPYAGQMLMPLSRDGTIVNLFELFAASAPEIGEMARRFPSRAGRVCEDHRVVLPQIGQSVPPTLSLTLQKADANTFIAILTDVTAAARRERYVHDSEERLHAVLDGIKGHSIFTVDADGIITSWSRAAERLDDYRADEATGRHMNFLVASTAWSKSQLTRCLEIAARDGSASFEGWRVRKDGHRYWANTAIGALKTRAGSVSIGFSVMTQNLTERRRVEDRLRFLAETDPLTGALNRRSFFAEAARLETAAAPLTALLIDADHFKRINDTHGHESGDGILQRIVADCRAEIRVGDILGRMGGEEFGILLASSTAANGALIAERIRARIEESGQAPTVQRCTVSIGVAARSVPGEPIEALIKRADLALFAAKSAGRNCVKVSSTE